MHVAATLYPHLYLKTDYPLLFADMTSYRASISSLVILGMITPPSILYLEPSNAAMVWHGLEQSGLFDLTGFSHVRHNELSAGIPMLLTFFQKVRFDELDSDVLS